MSDIVQRVAMKAAIVHDGKVLILREAATNQEGTAIGRYQMPGGRIEPGEKFDEALRREILEETGLEVELVMPVYVGEWSPVIQGVPHQIIATYIICRPTGSVEVRLSREHDHFEWIDPRKSADYDLMDAEQQVAARLADLQSRGVLESTAK